MGKEPETLPVAARRSLDGFLQRTDTYGLVLILILLDYVAVSALNGSGWGRVCIVALLGLTLWYTLLVSRAPRIWQILAVFYVVASTVSVLLGEVTPGADVVAQRVTISAGVLLFITPVAIARRISTHRVITAATVMGAVSVYLLIGMSFTFIFSAIAYLSGTPFFSEQPTATINNYLFFSYSTLTTVGYGNLVPDGYVGQTFAMLEALFGQIYLVIVVARLVSLWGQERPRTVPRMPPNAKPEDEDSHEPLPGGGG